MPDARPDPTNPIPILSSRSHRNRSASLSSASSGSASSALDPNTPPSTQNPISIPSPGSSPILSYFLHPSPCNSSAPAFKHKFGTTPCLADPDREPPVVAHARRASTTAANRLSQTQPSQLPDERGTGFLRRLSLSSVAFTKAQPDIMSGPRSPPRPPPNSAVSPTAESMPFGSRPRRATTKERRAPSPMGERILKGHFDGFN